MTAAASCSSKDQAQLCQTLTKIMSASMLLPAQPSPGRGRGVRLGVGVRGGSKEAAEMRDHPHQKAVHCSNILAVKHHRPSTHLGPRTNNLLHFLITMRGGVGGGLCAEWQRWSMRAAVCQCCCSRKPLPPAAPVSNLLPGSRLRLTSQGWQFTSKHSHR